MHTLKKLLLLVAAVGIFTACISAVFAEEVQPAAIKPIILTQDTEILKRTPVIDGVIEDGEWDGFYSFTSGDWQASAYINWDNSNIYIAALSNKPFDFLSLVDVNNDGWFHGEENYEIVALRSADGMLNKSVFRYESKNSISPAAVPVSVQENAMIDLKSTTSAGSYMIEMCIPKRLVRTLNLTPNKKIGLQVALKTDGSDTAWVPNKVQGENRECAGCTLVNKKFVALSPLQLGFDLSDAVVAKGEELSGRFHITNAGIETVDVRSFVIAGEGKAGEYLNSQKVRVDGLTPKKHVAQDYSTLVPKDMRTGTWALGAEIKSADSKLGAALISFDVVEPYEIELNLPTAAVPANAKDITFSVDVKNNLKRDMRGNIKVVMPIGWTFERKADSQSFNVMGGGKLKTTVKFTVRAPLGVQGDIPVKVKVTSNDITKTTEGTFKLSGL